MAQAKAKGKSRKEIDELGLDRLYGMLRDEKYLAVNRTSGDFENFPVTRDFLKALVRTPFSGLAPARDIDDYLYGMTVATVKKSIVRINDTKPTASTTERTALVFDMLDRYETGMKGAMQLLENNKYAKGFLGTEAFKDIWRDIISVSQVLTMTSFDDMKAFMQKNGDSDSAPLGRIVRH